MLKNTVWGILAACAVVAAPSVASAQRLNLDYSQRPITLPARMGRLDADLAVYGLSVNTPLGTVNSTSTALLLGGGFGITDDLEIGGLLAPIVISPDARYGNPSLYGRYRIARGPTEISLDLGVRIPTRDGENVTMTLGPNALLRVPNGRIDLGLLFNIHFSDPASTDVIIPFRYGAQLNPNLSLGVSTGLFVPNNFKFENGSIPLGVFGRYAIQGLDHGPLMDLVASFDFNNFIQFSGSDTIQAGIWTLGLGARFYLYL